MKIRSLLYLLVGLVLATALVGSATAVAAEGGKDMASMMEAQRHTPLLWMVDGCSVIILLGSWLFGAAIEAQPSGGRGGLASQQVALLMDRIAELEALTREQEARVETLEHAGDAWHDGFDTEAARLTEQAFLALSDGIEANAQQLENITMALRYQRTEMKTLRSAIKQVSTLPEPSEAAPSLESIPRPPRAVTPQLKKATPTPEAEPGTGESVVEDEVEGGAVFVEDAAPEAAADPEEAAAEADEAALDVQSAIFETGEGTSTAASVSSVEIDVDQIQRERENAELRAAATAEEFNSGKTARRSVFRKQRGK